MLFKMYVLFLDYVQYSVVLIDLCALVKFVESRRQVEKQVDYLPIILILIYDP